MKQNCRDLKAPPEISKSMLNADEEMMFGHLSSDISGRKTNLFGDGTEIREKKL